MNAQTILLRLLGFIAIAVGGGALFAVTVNVLILLDLTPTELHSQPYGTVLASKAAFIWMGSILLSLIAVFIKANWRWVLYAAPLYAPSLFSIAFTLSNKGAV